VPSKRYTNQSEDIPTVTLPPGYAAAEKKIRRGCGHTRKGLAVRLLDELRTAGFQGAAALEFFAECLLWYLVGSESVPIPGGKLKRHEIDAIRERASDRSIALLQPLEPFAAPLASERLGLDPFDHLPIRA